MRPCREPKWKAVPPRVSRGDVSGYEARDAIENPLEMVGDPERGRAALGRPDLPVAVSRSVLQPGAAGDGASRGHARLLRQTRAGARRSRLRAPGTRLQAHRGARDVAANH